MVVVVVELVVVVGGNVVVVVVVEDDVVVVGGSVVVVVGARVVVVVVGARVVVVVGAAVVVVVGGGVLTVSVNDRGGPPSVKEYKYVPGTALVPIWKLKLNAPALPDLPIAMPGLDLGLMSTFPPVSLVTLTLTELPGSRVADPGLTLVITARAGTTASRTIIATPAAKRALRIRKAPY